MIHKTVSKSLLAPALVGLTTIASEAASVLYEAKATLAPGSTSGTQIATGDSYLFSFTYDDAATDTNGSSTSGTFSPAVVSMTITPDPGNTGTWNGTIATPLALPGIAQTNPTNITFSSSPIGFTVINGIPINDFSASFTRSGLIIDSGSGQTISDQLGGGLDGNPGNFESANLLLEGDGGNIVLNLSNVPEPNSMILLFAGLFPTLIRRKRS